MRVKSKPDAQNDPDVQAAVKKVSEELGDIGRILIRESGTEPVIRVMVEAESNEICEKTLTRSSRSSATRAISRKERLSIVLHPMTRCSSHQGACCLSVQKNCTNALSCFPRELWYTQKVKWRGIAGAIRFHDQDTAAVKSGEP